MRSRRRIILDETGDEALAARAGHLEASPPLRQPDLLAKCDQLKRQQGRDDLEDVGHAAGRIGSAGTPMSMTKRIAKLFPPKSSMRLPSVFSPSPASHCSS